MRYQLRYIRILHQGEIVVPLRCMTIMHYRSGTQIPGSRLRLPCEKGTPAVLVFPRPLGPVAQWKSVRFTRGRSLVRSQPGPPSCTGMSQAWSADISRRTVERAEQVEAIEGGGWTVAVVWEHEDPATVADRLGIGTAAA